LHKHFFFTDSLLESVSSGSPRIVMHPPADQRRRPLIVVDKPCETNRIWAYNLVVENATHVFLYYHVFTAPSEDPSMLCLALSTDLGKRFYKPRLGHVPWSGTDESTNIVYFGSLEFPGHGFDCGGGGCEPGAVFIDPNPQAAAAERFKLMLFGPAEPIAPGGVWPLVSPDGIRWKVAGAKPIYFDSDSQQVAMWEPSPTKPGTSGKYVVYMRTEYLAPSYPNRTCQFCGGEFESRIDGLCKPHCGLGIHAIWAIGRCESKSFTEGWDECLVHESIANSSI
jgi:hypothetical protein